MRPRLVLALLLVCLSTPLLAQTPDEPTNDAPATQPSQIKPPVQPPATAAITGTVYCNDTHRPARGAMVMAQGIPKKGRPDVNLSTSMSRVGLDGTYTLPHLRPGDYTVIALLPGYLSPFDDLQIDQASGPNEDEMRQRLVQNGVVSVRDNETAHMDVSLERGASISGRVLYSDGSPATQILLNVEDIHAKSPTKKPDPNTPDINAGALVRGFFLHQSQGTDDQGNFRISGIKSGTYRIAAIEPAGNLSDGDGDGFGMIFGMVGNPRSIRIYSGDTLHKNNAKTYELRAGDDVTGVEITIPVFAFHRVQGQLTTLDGTPIFAGALTLTDTSDDSFVLHSAPGRDGTFAFPEVPSGTYNLSVTGAMNGTLPSQYPENAPIDAAALQNSHIFADKTTTVLVKDTDITDLTVQLQIAQPTPNQSSNTAPAANPSPENNH
ncbi:MAG TPA: hypothetical protein VGU25_04895 [Acidobacteriaceae bacterium]|nr:hypothetical protein [Acidobacteriaceae bacterium]